MAASLLRGTPLSVLEISQEVGFETLSSFNRFFLKNFHSSPRAWRKAQTFEEPPMWDATNFRNNGT
jgi:AraC-like DNA-binding protein